VTAETTREAASTTVLPTVIWPPGRDDGRGRPGALVMHASASE